MTCSRALLTLATVLGIWSAARGSARASCVGPFPKVLRAWDAGARGHALFDMKDLDYDALLRMSVGELRELLGLPREGIAQFPRKLHGLAQA